MTAPKRQQNIPAEVHQDKRHVLAFFQGILGYEQSLIQVGMSVKQGSSVVPAGFLRKSGQVVLKADYPMIWEYAQNDPAYTTTATTVTIPADATFIVRVT